MPYVNVNKLRGKIVELGMNVTILAEKLGMDRATLYRKLENGGSGLTVKDANEIVKELGLTVDEAMMIFFAQHVA